MGKNAGNLKSGAFEGVETRNAHIMIGKCRDFHTDPPAD